MKNKSLLPILLLAALTLGACNLGGQSSKESKEEQPASSEVQPSSEDTTQYGVVIANKAQLQEQWFVGDNRDVDVTLTPAANPLKELGKNLSVASSNAEVVAVTGLGLSAVGAGTATITVNYHGVTDSVDVTITSNDPKARYGTAHAGTEADPFTNEDAILVAEAAGSTATSEKYYVRGVVDSFRDAPSSYGNVSFYFTPAQEGGKKFLAYRVKLGEAGTNVTADDIWIGGTATIYCNMYNYNGNTPENSAGWLVSCTGEKQTIQNHDVNVAGAIAACKALGANGASDGKDTYDITGYIVKVDGTNLFLSDTKGAVASVNNETMFEVYNYTGENKDQCTLNAKIKVSCTIKYYKSSTTDAFAYETSTISAIEILEQGEAPALKITGAPALETLVAGTYKLGLLQTNLNQNCFFKGTINSSKYAEITTKWSEAVDVVVGGDATNGFTMKVGDKYISPVADGTKVRTGLVDSEVKYQWNELAHTLTTSFKVGDKTDTYYFGTYGTNSTLGFSALSYLIKDNKLVDGQYASQFYAKAECNADPTGIQFVTKEASALAGVPCELSFRINPYNVDLSKLVWETSDDTVATVAAGVVTGLKAGKVTITAKFGTAIIDTIEVNVAEVNLGSLEAPLTVEEALAAADTLKLAAGSFSPKTVYVKGVVANRADTFVNGDYFGKWDLKAGDKKIYVVNSKPVAAVKGNVFENDEVIVSGFLTKDATEGVEFLKNASNVYPVVESITQRGTSTVTIGDHANATVSELSKESGENLSTFTFKVAADEGYAIDWVKVNGQEVEAAAGVYTGTIQGNTVITVKASEALVPPAAPVTIAKTIAQLVPTDTANGTQIGSFELDQYVTVSVNTDGNNGKIYGTGTEWRLYQGNNPKVTVTVPSGCVITSITFTFDVGNTGTLKYGDAVLTSGTAVAIDNLAKAEFTVGNSGSATNGQIKIKGFSVTYGPASAAQPEIAQPVGEFHGVVKLIAAAGGGLQPVDMYLTADSVALYINGAAVTVSSYNWDKVNGAISVVTDGGYGTVSAAYDADNNAFSITGVTGANGAYIDTAYVVTLHGNALFYNCDGSTSELQEQFDRRFYRSGTDSNWVYDTYNADKISKEETIAVQGSSAKLRAIAAGASNRNAICLKSDFSTARPTTTISFWVYNDGASDVTLRAWGYQAANKGTNFEYVNIDGSGSMVAKAGQWTFITMTFYSGGNATQKNIYNFQIADMNSTQGETLYFDNICLL